MCGYGPASFSIGGASRLPRRVKRIGGPRAENLQLESALEQVVSYRSVMILNIKFYGRYNRAGAMGIKTSSAVFEAKALSLSSCV